MLRVEKSVDSGVVARPIHTSYSAPPSPANQFRVEIFGHIWYDFQKVFKQSSRRAFMPDVFMPSCGTTWEPEQDTALGSAAKFRMICGTSVREIVP
jgi:hypothetical protein